ncbi:MAG: hypothetical protein SFY67_16565 [Candidatus Melainabacteria bacterium]|nr:hypothetical protein [Candidatus Melainabacteria bacterium]
MSEKSSTRGDSTHKWLFLPRFRSGAFGWKSDTPIKRLKEAVLEIKKVSRKEPTLAAEGSIKLIERISNALMNVDGSSGAMRSAVNAAIEELVKVISNAKCDTETRAYWLKRLYEAHEADEIPYIEALADYFGELCASKELASKWADKLIEPTKSYLTDRKSFMSSFSGTSVCLSCLFKAERYDELLQLLRCYQYNLLDYKSWGAKALAAQGKIDEAIEYAESCKDSRNIYEDIQISQLCEEILLQAKEANQKNNWQRACDNYARAAASKIGKDDELVASINDRIQNANPKDFVVKAIREKL